jgi:branched-chain amino acid transport system permease protein
MAFALSGALGGLAGALSTYYYRNVSIEDFDLLLSVSYLAMVIIGGLGSVQGAIYGAVFVTATPFLVGKAVEVLGLTAVLGTRLRAIELGVFALTMMAFLLFEPQGLAGVWQRVKAYFARWPFKYTDMTTSAKR